MMLARGIWVGLVLVMLGLLAVFAVYFWHWARVMGCYQPTCAVMLSSFAARGIPIEVYAVLYVVALVCPPIIWISSAIWIFVMRPQTWWTYVFSLFFLVGWYGEVNHQYIRGSLPDALRFAVTQLGFADSPALLEVATY